MAVKARIWWDTSIQAYKLQCQFKPQLVDFLKTQIPVSDRSFDPTTKIWTFTENYLQGVRALCVLLYGVNDVAVLERKTVEGQARQAPTSVHTTNTLDSLCVQFVKLLPFDAAQTAYRKAALLLHPDRGGDMEKMSQLNVVWTRLEKEIWPNG